MTAPLRYLVLDCDTRALKGYLTEDGQPNGPSVIVGEPTFGADLNFGMRELQLRLSKNPLDALAWMTLFDWVRVLHPDGRILGDWWYVKSSAGTQDDEAKSKNFILHLFPIATELTNADYAANYTSQEDAEHQTQLGAARWSVPALAAIARTKHCTAGTIADDGVAYDMLYPKYSRAVDTLNRAIDQGGPDWWWYCNGTGHVELRQGARATYTLTFADDVITETAKTLDGTALWNEQPLNGGTVQATEVFGGLSYPVQKPLTGYAENTTGSSPYRIARIGRRLAPTWNDPNVMSQTAADHEAAQVLARRGVPIITFDLKLRPQAPVMVPGDKVDYTDSSGATNTGLWVKSVEEVGSTREQLVSLVSQFDVRERPFRARGSASAAATPFNGTVPGLASGGGACGGFQPLARTPPGTVSGTLTGADIVPVRLNFVLDSGDSCQIVSVACCSVKITPSGTGTDGTLRLVADLGGGGGWGGGYSVDLPFDSDGKWHALTLWAPSGMPLPAGSYQAYLILTGPAGSYQLRYDVETWLYAGGGSAA